MNTNLKFKAIGFVFKIFLIFFIAFLLFTLIFLNSIDKILYNPLTMPREWLAKQPHIEIGLESGSIIIIQPTSTFFVYFLGVIATLIGIFLIIRSKSQKSRIWWGIAVIFWGLGALFAGTSYQIFSYEIKCEGRIFCLWTSWWEIIYLLFSVGSVNAMMMAQSFSVTTGKWRIILKYYAFISMCAYIILVSIGIAVPIKFLISFELMVLFLVPNIILFFGINLIRYLKYHLKMDLFLIIIWLSLGIIIGLYFLYYILDLTSKLWNTIGIWFSENDILHIGLILWMIIIEYSVQKYVVDLIPEKNALD